MGKFFDENSYQVCIEKFKRAIKKTVLNDFEQEKFFFFKDELSARQCLNIVKDLLKKKFPGVCDAKVSTRNLNDKKPFYFVLRRH